MKHDPSGFFSWVKFLCPNKLLQFGMSHWIATSIFNDQLNSVRCTKRRSRCPRAWSHIEISSLQENPSLKHQTYNFVIVFVQLIIMLVHQLPGKQRIHVHVHVRQLSVNNLIISVMSCMEYIERENKSPSNNKWKSGKSSFKIVHL